MDKGSQFLVSNRPDGAHRSDRRRISAGWSSEYGSDTWRIESMRGEMPCSLGEGKFCSAHRGPNATWEAQRLALHDLGAVEDDPGTALHVTGVILSYPPACHITAESICTSCSRCVQLDPAPSRALSTANEKSLLPNKLIVP